MTYTQTIKKIQHVCSFAVILAISAFLSAKPASAASASFYTSGGGKVNTGQTITVSVSVTGSEAYNAVEATVNFNNLVFISAAPIGGWTTFSGPTRSGNSVSYTGALFGTSSTGSKGVLNLTFKAPNTPGTSSISSSGTITILNGNTKVSGGGNTATYSVVTPPPAPSPSPTPKPGPNAVNISSTSHPDANQWYKNKEVLLSWNKQEGVTDFSYAIDGSPETNPGETSAGADTSKTIVITDDGTYYFHIKAKNDVGWGPVSHYTVRIDSSAPDPFTITKVGEESANEFVLYFATADSGSGVTKFTVSVDGQDKGEQKSGQLKVEKAAKSVTVTATDKAGNTTQSTLDLQKAPVSTIVVPSTTGTETQTQVVTVEKPSKFSVLDIVLTVITALLAVYAGIMSYLYIKSSDRTKQVEKGKKETTVAESSPISEKKIEVPVKNKSPLTKSSDQEEL